MFKQMDLRIPSPPSPPVIMSSDCGGGGGRGNADTYGGMSSILSSSRSSRLGWSFIKTKKRQSRQLSTGKEKRRKAIQSRSLARHTEKINMRKQKQEEKKEKIKNKSRNNRKSVHAKKDTTAAIVIPSPRAADESEKYIELTTNNKNKNTLVDISKHRRARKRISEGHTDRDRNQCLSRRMGSF